MTPVRKLRIALFAIFTIALFVGVTIGVFYVSLSSSSKQAVAPTAPESKPAAGCKLGDQICQGAGGTNGNNGWLCTCFDSSKDYSCSVQDTKKCPVGANKAGDKKKGAVFCTDILTGKKFTEGKGVCTTSNGKQNGNYCTCVDGTPDAYGIKIGDTGAWQCKVDTNKCKIEVVDPRVAGAGAKSNCEGVTGVTVKDGCVEVASKTDFAHFYCPNQSKSELFSKGCAENGKVTKTTKECLKYQCGGQQIDFVANGTSCYYSNYITCATPAPTDKVVTPTETVTPTGTITPTDTPTGTPTGTTTPTDSPTATKKPTKTITKKVTATITRRPTTTRAATRGTTPQPTVLPETGIMDMFSVVTFGGGLLMAVIGILLAL